MTTANNKAWEQLFTKYSIPQRVAADGSVTISAEQIKEFREPRLMAKFDTSAVVPPVFKKHHINIVPTSRRSYCLGDFILYEPLPLETIDTAKAHRVAAPYFETLRLDDVTSEANALNLMNVSGILDDFLGTHRCVPTFSGRMGSGQFSFFVNGHHRRHHINVTNAQVEIDAGYETDNEIIIVEAKRVINEDFHIRQLYYPLRRWAALVHKPIRLVFVIYTNKLFNLLEYTFDDVNDYSSLQFVSHGKYSLDDTHITSQDLATVRRGIDPDDSDDPTTPFPQADSFSRIISLLEQLYNGPLTGEEIAQFMDFTPRQSDYYFNAAKYLGLCEKVDEGGAVVVRLTDCGQRVASMPYRPRQLALVEKLLTKPLFYHLSHTVIDTGVVPDRRYIQQQMRAFNVCGDKLIARRSGTVAAWLQWMRNLTTV